MKSTTRDLITYALAILARILTPSLQRQISRLCLRLSHDIPLLGTTWTVAFVDPTRTGGERNRVIDASLQQFGRFVRGKGHVHGEPHDEFVYRGTIKRNTVYGSFERLDSHVLAGTGTFVLKISADSHRLTGFCSWYDSLLDDVWACSYRWKRTR